MAEVELRSIKEHLLLHGFTIKNMDGHLEAIKGDTKVIIYPHNRSWLLITGEGKGVSGRGYLEINLNKIKSTVDEEVVN